MKLGEFVKGSFKNAVGSSQNFMSPGVGSVYTGSGNAPVSPVPGVGTFMPAKEGGLAAKASDKLGINLGTITADSYTTAGKGLAGLSSYDGDKRAAVEEELKTKQEDAHLNSLTKKLLNAGNNNNTATV